MENEYVKPSPWGTAIKWGLIGGVVSVILNQLTIVIMGDNYLKEFDWKGMIFGVVSVVLGIVFLITAQKEHKNKELSGYMSYGRAMGVAAIYAIFISVVAAMDAYLTYAVFYPELSEVLREASLEKMAELDLSEDQLEKNVEWLNMSTGPLAKTMTSFFGTFFWFIVVGLISSAFVHKNNPEQI